MSRGKVWMWMGVLLVLALSGCSGEPEPEEPVEAGPEPGIIEGRVVNGDGFPVVEARVEVLRTNLSATTDEEGAFEIDHVEPGPVVLVATKVGYSSKAQRNELGDEGRLQMEFRLIQAPTLKPHRVELGFEGVLECALPEGIGCGPLVEQDSTHHRFRVAPGLRGVVVELTWDPPVQQAGEVSGELRVEAAAATSQACGETIKATTGPDVLRLPIEKGFPVAGGHLCVIVWPAGDAVAQQAYRVHVTLFYHEEVPGGFSATGA